MNIYINKKEVLIIGIVSLILGFSIPFIFFGHLVEKNDSFLPWQSIFTSITYTFSLWFFNALFLKFIWKKYPIQKYVFYNVLCQIIFIPIITATVVVVLVYIDAIFMKLNYQDFFKKNMIISMSITLFIASIYNSIYLFNHLKKSIAEKEKLEKANIQSQLEILKNQIKPHFLFNSLNTLASLIPEDTEQSVKYVESLAKVYRYILEIKDKKLISVKEELNCISAYLFMLQIRFGTNLKIKINEVGLEDSHHIVPLSLQLLIENAMKHNIVSNKRPLFIQIFKGTQNRLLVVNNLQKKENLEPSTGIGLQNIDKRYRMISKEKIEMIVTEEKFTVSIPLINIHNHEA